jgi:hypothetical protein
MSLIRKPDVEVFRDSGAVVAMRGAKELVREGAGGVLGTIGRVWMTMALLAFMGSGLGAMFTIGGPLQGLVCAGLIVGSIYGLWRIWQAPTREAAFEDGATAPGAGISVPLPEHLRLAAAEEGFHVDYWPKAFVNLAILLFVGGFFLITMDPWNFGPASWTGIVMVTRGVLLLSLMFGGRTCVTASRDRLTVHTLLGDGSIAWSDITDITVRTVNRRHWWIMLSTGGRHHIRVCGHQRFGKSELLIPYKLLGLDSNGVFELKRRIYNRLPGAGAPETRALTPQMLCRPEPEQPRGFDPDAIMNRYLSRRDSAPVEAAPPPDLPDATPRKVYGRSAPEQPTAGFDPDAIMARYLAERDTMRQAMPPIPAGPPVRTFGRKRA